MSTTVTPGWTRSRATGMPSPNATSSVPPPAHLTAAQRRELEAELRYELVALDRRLVGESQPESAEPLDAAARDVSDTRRPASDTAERRDLVAAALARLVSGEYGTCSRCGEAIPYGRLIVMPEATHCLRCSGRP